MTKSHSGTRQDRDIDDAANRSEQKKETSKADEIFSALRVQGVTSDLTLSTLANGAALPPVPYLSRIVSLASTICDAPNKCYGNKRAFRSLADDTCNLVYAIYSTCDELTKDGAEISPELQTSIQKLCNTLEEMETFAQKRRKKKGIAWFLACKDDEKVQAFRQQMRQGLDLFTLQSNITVQQIVSRAAAQQRQLLAGKAPEEARDEKMKSESPPPYHSDSSTAQQQLLTRQSPETRDEEAKSPPSEIRPDVSNTLTVQRQLTTGHASGAPDGEAIDSPPSDVSLNSSDSLTAQQQQHPTGQAPQASDEEAIEFSPSDVSLNASNSLTAQQQQQPPAGQVPEVRDHVIDSQLPELSLDTDNYPSGPASPSMTSPSSPTPPMPMSPSSAGPTAASPSSHIEFPNLFAGASHIGGNIQFTNVAGNQHNVHTEDHSVSSNFNNVYNESNFNSNNSMIQWGPRGKQGGLPERGRNGPRGRTSGKAPHGFDEESRLYRESNDWSADSDRSLVVHPGQWGSLISHRGRMPYTGYT